MLAEVSLKTKKKLRNFPGASQRIAERLTGCIAHRDQAGIAKDLASSDPNPL